MIRKKGKNLSYIYSYVIATPYAVRLSFDHIDEKGKKAGKRTQFSDPPKVSPTRHEVDSSMISKALRVAVKK